MNIGIKVLRFFFPKREAERCAWRETVARNTAHAEDLTRSLANLDDDTVTDFARQIQKKQRKEAA